MKFTFRWLGAAGLELRLDRHTLLIDPFFSRPSVWAVLTGRGRLPNPDLVARYTPRCEHVLVTHPHYDHLLDVPEVMRQTGAQAAGSPNTCTLLSLLGLPSERLTCLAVGDRRQIGPWALEVLPAWHTRTPLDGRINAPLPPDLRAPPHLLDYRMDTCFSFLLQAGDLRLLVGSHPPAEQVDTLFVLPFLPAPRLRALLQQARPRRVVPIHWDDFTRPLSQPPRAIPFTTRLSAFTRTVQSIVPGCQVLIEEANRGREADS